jgi:hypothetical protein
LRKKEALLKIEAIETFCQNIWDWQKLCFTEVEAVDGEDAPCSPRSFLSPLYFIKVFGKNDMTTGKKLPLKDHD